MPSPHEKRRHIHIKAHRLFFLRQKIGHFLTSKELKTVLALFQRRGHFVYPACGSSNTSVVDKWSCPRFFMSSPQRNNRLEKSEFMNETHALTDRQIARRKTAAIWLVGVGVLLSPLLRIFFQKLIEYRLIKDIWEAQYATHLMGINHIALSILCIDSRCRMVSGRQAARQKQDKFHEALDHGLPAAGSMYGGAASSCLSSQRFF